MAKGITPALIAKYGEPGSIIPGTKHRRAYCGVCGEPIRIKARGRYSHGTCDRCMGMRPRTRTSTDPRRQGDSSHRVVASF